MKKNTNASERYLRNELYIEPTLQARLKSCRVLMAGVGLGSYIAECLLRTGFENITLADGDTVEMSNLNRQNYVESDIGKKKAEMNCARLQAIHTDARIAFSAEFLTKENIPAYVREADFIVNAIDFESDAHIFLDRVALHEGKTTILPMNLGFAALAAVFGGHSPELSTILSHPSESYPVAILNQLKTTPRWLKEVLQRYVVEKPLVGYDPQLAIGSFLAASLVSSILVRLVQGEEIKCFPHWHFLDTRTL